MTAFGLHPIAWRKGREEGPPANAVPILFLKFCPPSDPPTRSRPDHTRLLGGSGRGQQTLVHARFQLFCGVHAAAPALRGGAACWQCLWGAFHAPPINLVVCIKSSVVILLVERNVVRCEGGMFMGGRCESGWLEPAFAREPDCGRTGWGLVLRRGTGEGMGARVGRAARSERAQRTCRSATSEGLGRKEGFFNVVTDNRRPSQPTYCARSTSLALALKCLTPDQSKPGPNLPGAHVARALAIRAPCRARVCVRRSRGASGGVAGLRLGRGGQPPGPSHRKFEPPKVPAPASPPRAILSRSGDAMALIGLGSSATRATDEVHRSCSPAWACGPWSRPERTGAKRRTLALGPAPTSL
jgi:hypothetical protein